MDIYLEDAEPPDRPGPPGHHDWMWELARHYELMRKAYPEDVLCVVFDIDGTILDLRHQVVHVLVSYDREHGTNHFRGLTAEDITVSENHVSKLLEARALPQATRNDILAFYRERLWRPEAILAASRPYRGVLSVIRWFQLQPRTVVALNTGRPERLRNVTLESLNTVGRAYRVYFDPDLLCMNPEAVPTAVPEGKVRALHLLRHKGLRPVAVVDNEPANIEAMAASDDGGEILFLHAETIFESQRVDTPRTVRGSRYELAGLVRPDDLGDRVTFIWHGVNDRANLRQFLASDVHRAELDVREDPLGRLVLRHDSFEETPWTRTEEPLLLVDALRAISDAGRAATLDLKEGGPVVARILDEVRSSGPTGADVGFLGGLDVLGQPDVEAIKRTFPEAPVTVVADPLIMLLARNEDLLDTILQRLARWGVTGLALDWAAPATRRALDPLAERGWDVNLYGIPDLEGFLEAALLQPAAVTADFNFPDLHYYGRGAGQRHRFHRYTLAGSSPP